MEFTIDKRPLLRALARTHAVADRKSSMPILSNVLIEAHMPDKLRLAATDLYLGVQANVGAEVAQTGSVALSARTLFDIVKNLPEGMVRWNGDDEGGAVISSGKVRYKIPALSAKDFPALPDPADATFSDIDAAVVAELIQRTQYSMSSDDTRPHLSGALFEGEGQILRMVTTDGHRLSKAEYKIKGKNTGTKFSMLVPHKGIVELKRVLEDAKAEAAKSEKNTSQVSIAVNGAQAFFRRDGVQLSIKLTDDQFPPYSKVIPQSQQRRVVVGRGLLSEALRRISLVASDKSGGVRMHIEPGILKITSENPDIGEGAEEVDVDFSGDPVVVGFNARYMLDVLSSLTEDEVALELSGELDPGVIRPVGETDFVGVIMPMRI